MKIFNQRGLEASAAQKKSTVNTGDPSSKPGMHRRTALKAMMAIPVALAGCASDPAKEVLESIVSSLGSEYTKGEAFEKIIQGIKDYKNDASALEKIAKLFLHGFQDIETSQINDDIEKPNGWQNAFYESQHTHKVDSGLYTSKSDYDVSNEVTAIKTMMDLGGHGKEAHKTLLKNLNEALEAEDERQIAQLTLLLPYFENEYKGLIGKMEEKYSKILNDDFPNGYELQSSDD